jgi:hypothetical protein
MKISPLSLIQHLFFAVSLAASAGAAHARNDKLLLPIDVALRSVGSQALSQDVQLRFGKASAAGAQIVGSVEAHATADPYAFNNSGGNNPTGVSGSSRRERLSDDQVCLAAFRKALRELQQNARAAGAGAVVGIVSNYDHVEFDSSNSYECHVGITRAVVDLRGQTVRIAPAPAPAAATLSAPVSPTAQPPRIATGFAAIDDVDAIPYLSDKGREEYRVWVTRPTPKAFAISSTGHWFGAWSLKPGDPSHPTDPTERALLVCSQRAQQPCKLYAVNGSVVWPKAAQ